MSKDTRGKGKEEGGGTKMQSLVLTGRNVRLVLLDVGAHSRVLDGGNLSECATVTTEPLHVKQPGLSLLSVCLSFSQSVLSVSACPRRCYNEMCDPSKSDSATLQGKMWKYKKRLIDQILTRELLVTSTPADLWSRCLLSRLSVLTHCHPRSPQIYCCLTLYQHKGVTIFSNTYEIQDATTE